MVALYLIVFLVAVGPLYMVFDYYRMRKIARERGGPNICAYARSFDYRNTDTKIMREVWNEVQYYLGEYDGKPFPISSDDLFAEIYNLDPDDLDDIYWAVADRMGIETENPERNPYFNQVTSVRNLVLFLQNQPKKAANV
jgi:hypothetical protein